MRALIIVLAIILITLFSGCQRDANFYDKKIYQAYFNYISQGTTEEKTVVISERAETEQDIFSISLDDSLKEMNSSSKLRIKSVRELQNLLPASSVRLQAKFIEAINRGGNINTNDIPTNTKIKPLFVSDAELNTFFEKGLAHAWEHFPTKYPGAQSLIKLSRPAIDLETDTAIIFASVSCGGLCGQDNLYLLAKTNGKWMVVHEHRMRIS